MCVTTDLGKNKFNVNTHHLFINFRTDFNSSMMDYNIRLKLIYLMKMAMKKVYKELKLKLV